MKTSVAVFASHHDAVSSIVALKKHDFPLSKVSLVGQAELVDEKIQVQSNDKLINTPVIAGTVLGTTIGLLTGVGLFAIPGFGLLFGAGAVVGALGGFELGVATGGFVTLLLQMGIHEDYAVVYDEHIKDGKFLLMIDGSNEEIDLARKIIGEEHIEYNIHERRHAV